MAKLKNLHDVLTEEVKDLYNAETQLTHAIPHFIRAAEDPSFRSALMHHLTQTKRHVARLRQVADHLGVSPAGVTCKGMKGLVAEGEERIVTGEPGGARDASLICAVQKMEHYEIAAYGCVRTFAQVLGLHQVAEILQTTLDEECAEDRSLSGLADYINSRADMPAEWGGLTVVS